MTAKPAPHSTGSATDIQDPGPRPVFDGDWNSASGSEKGKHSERVRQWQRRVDAAAEAEAQAQAASGFSQPAPPVPTPDATTAVLVAIRDDTNAHDSDRIAAAKALTAMEREAQATTDGPSPLVALRQVLDTLQPHERLAWLQGERVEGMRTKG
jgi:hypothetical protein